MTALSKMAKNTIYGSRVGVRADFQDFVIVDKFRRFHRMPHHGLGAFTASS